MESIDTRDVARHFRPFTNEDLETLADCVEMGFLSKQDFLNMLPANIANIPDIFDNRNSIFLIEEEIKDVPIESRFEILDL